MVELEVVSSQFEVTQAMLDHARKAGRKLQKLKVEPTYNHINLKKEGSDFVAEYEVRSGLSNFFAKSSDPDCYLAITGAVAKVIEQVKRKLEKVQH